MTTTIRKLGAQIAAHLPGFTLEPTRDDLEHGCYLAHLDGRRLHLRRDWRNAERLTVAGSYPHEPNVSHYAKACQIGVGAARGPKVIAAEVVRRLLPAYEPELAKARAEIADAQQAQAAQARAAAELARLLPGARVDAGHGRGSYPAVRWYDRDDQVGSGTVRIDYRAETVSLEVRSLPVAAARRVLAALNAEARGVPW
jgi:hypothetical protein